MKGNILLVIRQGIEVVGDRTKRQRTQYQGKVALCNGAVIENALCGIYTGLREDTVAYATAGVYVLHVTDGEGKEYQQKVVRR